MIRIADLSFLVAEDHEFQRNALVRILTNLGARDVLAATDGKSALALLQSSKRPIDVVISDLDMPGMDGMEFVRHLGEIGSRASIVVASSLERSLLSSVEMMAAAYGIKILGTIPKPITPRKLEELISKHSFVSDQVTVPKPPATIFTLEEIAEGLKNNEFEPFFQPTIDLASGAVKGAEALARWRHPSKGIIAPGAFITVLEEAGMIDMLMWQMLNKAAAYCSSWRAAGLDTTVSVNLSLVSLSDLDLAERITRVIAAQNLEPRHMVLEITESAATTDVGKALENLARLRMKGFGLSIDDYGTGYSSMQQLTRIPFTQLKIDQSFVINAAKQDTARVILGASLEMAKKLKIAAVAEGVETKESWELLCDLKCDLAQGYLFAKPMEARFYLDWSRDWAKMR